MLIDVVRGLAISLVVLGHTNQGIGHRGWWGGSPFGGYLDETIYTFHMPAFFFVSGIFLCDGVNKRGPWRFTTARLRTILYPYVVWSLIFYASEILFRRWMVGGAPTVHQYLVNLVAGNFSWFLPTIFVAIMIGMLLRRIPAPVFFVLTSVVAIAWHPVGAGDIDNALHFLPFLVTGMWVGTRFDQLERIPRPAAAVCSVALCIAIAEAVIHRAPYFIFLFIPIGLIGIFMLLMLARALGRGAIARTIAWVGEASFGIFLISAFPQGAGRELVRHVLHTTAPLPQLIFPTLLAIFVPAWLYMKRERLHIGWLFIWPFPASSPKPTSVQLQSDPGPMQGLRG